jgi:ADP-ribose pyrophosphatase YjhB (NUDIX family)
VGGGWELPGGRVGQGEHPNNALLRGFGDGTGLVARIVALLDVTMDLAVDRDTDEVVHTDRILYEVRVRTHQTRNGARWADPARVPLAPFTAGLLGEPAGQPEIPPAEPLRDPAATRMQRFAAYGLTTGPAGRVLLTRIAPGYPGAHTWHLPGGGTDFGERADTGLLRELVEETAQHGRVTGLLEVSHYHNPRALGPEGHPMDWHTVRTLYRVVVDQPGVPSVVEAAGGSTAEAAWFDRADLGKVALNEFARRAFAHHLG